MRGRRVFELSGGRLCLDFSNTVDNRPSEKRKDLLETYADLAAWSRQAGILSSREESALLARAERAPERARKALARARRVREALFEVFASKGRAGLATLRTELPRAYRRPVLSGRGSVTLAWEDAPEALDCMLGPVLRSAVELLTSDELHRVRVCAAPDCDWLFMDESRSRSRQWCSMVTCGNRAKARRFYRRTRELKRRGSRGGRRSAGTRKPPGRG